MSEPLPIETTITRLGAHGDGVGVLVDGRPVYVAATVPEDRVRLALDGKEGDGMRGRLLEVLAPGPMRGTPPCPHFGICGGCALQHMAIDAYRDWKRGLLVDSLARNAVDAGEIAPLAMVATATRRRGTFFAEKRGGRVAAGFHERGSHRIAAIDNCLVLAPPLLALVDKLKPLATDLLSEGERIEVVANLLDTGLDVLIRLPRVIDVPLREKLARFARNADLARISVAQSGGRDRAAHADIVVERRPALATFGGAHVPVPPAAFLQASAEAEAMLVGEARTGIAGAKKVADLFAGAGTFTFALAADKIAVHAVEGELDLAMALKIGAGKAGLGPRISTEVRDLFRRPLLADELKKFEAVVFDPPRAGAKAQADALAKSKVPVVVGVSCNPASFARDARALQDGGFRLTRVLPVDQFLWTHHLEVVGTFVR
ncbi:MAG TPA: class I SAM-dependent RNA methyltransferase [Alphaproteobacteria bacterium]|nr:class I SAM-dependent RNA methyltransferase [Alphaproteobacteria bacterium]